MELLAACQAVDLRRSEDGKSFLLSEPLEKIYKLVRSDVLYVYNAIHPG